MERKCGGQWHSGNRYSNDEIEIIQGMTFQNKTWFCFENVKVRKSNSSALFNYMRMSAWHIFIVPFFLITDKNILLIRNIQHSNFLGVNLEVYFFPFSRKKMALHSKKFLIITGQDGRRGSPILPFLPQGPQLNNTLKNTLKNFLCDKWRNKLFLYPMLY